MDSPPASDSVVLHSEDKSKTKRSSIMFISTRMLREVLGWLMCLARGRARKQLVLMGLDSLIASDDADDVTNPFDFK
jgi:hypothetical protein